MRREQPEIRERRFKLELFELNDKLELKREGDDEKEFTIRGKTTSTNQEVPSDNSANEKVSEKINQPQEEKSKGKVLPPLCELVSFSARFALNDIPAATVVPATGKEIMYGGERLTYYKLQELAITSKPVGVYLTVLNSSRSFNEEKDNQYWPEKCCIFKGYLQPPMFEMSAYGAGRSITIWHWLSALADISLLTTACYIGNPSETTLQGYGLYQPAPKGLWEPVYEEASLENVWKEGIKPLYLKLLNWGEEKKDKYNSFVKEQRERIRTALDKIEQDCKVLKIKNSTTWLMNLIARDIQSDAMSDFVQIDGWSKLISDYCPSYLLAVSPQVDKVKIIPMPCTVNRLFFKEISRDEIFSMQATPFMAKKISHLSCVAIESPIDNNTPVGVPHYVGLGVYPPREIERDGINVTIGFPAWITQKGVSNIPDTTDQLDFMVNPKKGAGSAKTKEEEAEALNEVQHTVGQQYAQVAYLTQAFNSSFVRVAMPVNMNFCPGAMVKVFLSHDGLVAYYGTVASVEINLTSGNTAMTTVLTLSNIRDDTALFDDVDNPQEKVGFYESQWYGDDERLYAE